MKGPIKLLNLIFTHGVSKEPVEEAVVKLPEWKEGHDRDKLAKEIIEDVSLKHWKVLNDWRLRVYAWKDGLLVRKRLKWENEKS